MADAEEAALAAAANLISRADAILVCTGAGMGVDSGLGTFRGRNAGVWPPLTAMQMDFSEMSCPDWFEHDPHLAWAFWSFRHTAYMQSSPHVGYDIVAKWGSRAPLGFFVVTSNIDGHWMRTAAVGADRVLECHGAVTHMQAVQQPDVIVQTDAAAVAACTSPAWDLTPGEKVEIKVFNAQRQLAHPWIVAYVGDDGATIVGNDGKALPCGAVRRPGGPDLLRATEGVRLPEMPGGGAARPNVLMFGDGGVNFDRIDEQERRFNQWLDCHVGTSVGARVVVIEIGAGLAVPTVRRIAERTVISSPTSSLVRINLDDFSVPLDLEREGRAVALHMGGACDVLTRLDALIELSAGARQ